MIQFIYSTKWNLTSCLFGYIGIYSVWYSLRLPPAFSYYALGDLNDNPTKNISVRKT